MRGGLGGRAEPRRYGLECGLLDHVVLLGNGLDERHQSRLLLIRVFFLDAVDKPVPSGSEEVLGEGGDGVGLGGRGAVEARRL